MEQSKHETRYVVLIEQVDTIDVTIENIDEFNEACERLKASPSMLMMLAVREYGVERSNSEDTEFEWFGTLEQANNAAKEIWENLNKEDKEKHRVYVMEYTGEFFKGIPLERDWYYHSHDYGFGGFDSEVERQQQVLKPMGEVENRTIETKRTGDHPAEKETE